MKPGPGEGSSQGGRPSCSSGCWQRRRPAAEPGLPPLPCSPAAALGGAALTQDPHVIVHPEQGPLLRPPIHRLALGRLLDADGPGEPCQGRGERHGEAGPHGGPARPAAVADGALGAEQGSGAAQQGPARGSQQQQRCRRHGAEPGAGNGRDRTDRDGTGRDGSSGGTAPSAGQRSGAQVTSLQRSGGRGSRRLGEGPARGAAAGR